jgi:ubiquinone/menaquinone biosynthesis C-methylase UbiE
MVLNRAVRTYYEENPLMVSSPFGGIDGVNRALVERVFQQLDIQLENRSVLDVGCGRGYLGDVVRELGGRYTGADFVASRTDFRLVLADAAILPFPDAAFDAICCIDAFEHFPDPDAVAREFRRVVRPGGFLFLSVPNYANLAGVVKICSEALGWSPRDSWAPFRRWQPQELERFVTNARVRRIFARAGFNRARCMPYDAEVGLGLFPWMEHARMPETLRFRLQRVFRAIGPAVVRVWPGASLHAFWKFEG